MSSFYQPTTTQKSPSVPRWAERVWRPTVVRRPALWGRGRFEDLRRQSRSWPCQYGLSIHFIGGLAGETYEEMKLFDFTTQLLPENKLVIWCGAIVWDWWVIRGVEGVWRVCWLESLVMGLVWPVNVCWSKCPVCWGLYATDPECDCYM